MMKPSSDTVQKAYAKGCEDAAVFGNQAFDAMINNVDIVAKCRGVISKSWLQFTQAQFEDGMVTAKALSGCKIPN